jgi:hypothetical protein
MIFVNKFLIILIKMSAEYEYQERLSQADAFFRQLRFLT